MKKNIPILGALLIIIGLSTYGFINRGNTNVIKETSLLEKNSDMNDSITKKEIKVFEGFIYDIGPRFEGIKKEDLQKATSIETFYDQDHLNNMVTLKSVNVILVKNDIRSETKETSNTIAFNEKQLALLQSLDYSTNFIIQTNYIEKNEVSGLLENGTHNHHLTITPEKQASHFMGKETLKSYFKENCKDVLENVDPEKLLAAKIYFTIAKDGTIKNTYQDRASGYPEVDERMLKLIKELPGSWKPAENAKGEVVEQELVISFGLMGC